MAAHLQKHSIRAIDELMIGPYWHISGSMFTTQMHALQHRGSQPDKGSIRQGRPAGGCKSSLAPTDKKYNLAQNASSSHHVCLQNLF